MTKLLTLGILFSIAVIAVVLAKFVILSILPLTSFILALRAAVVAKLVILGISPLPSFILSLGISPLPSFTLPLRVILVAMLVITGFLFDIFYLGITYTFSNNIKLIGTFYNLSISNLSTLDFKIAKSTFSANLFFNHFFLLSV